MIGVEYFAGWASLAEFKPSGDGAELAAEQVTCSKNNVMRRISVSKPPCCQIVIAPHARFGLTSCGSICNTLGKRKSLHRAAWDGIDRRDIDDWQLTVRSNLFFIPHEIGGIPLFGIGWGLGLLVLAFVLWAAWLVAMKKPLGEELLAALPLWLVASGLVIFVLPNVEQTWPDGEPIGLPVRGYGVMVLAGLLAGIGITIHRGKQLRVSADTIIGLGFWMMLTGVVGARLFFVVQKWSSEFAPLPTGEQLIAIVKLTEGGLVIYGGVIGGLVAVLVYCWKKQLRITATADLVAPGFLIGLSLGRIGCLLHGCCFGGVCDAQFPSISFPHGSGPYVAQVTDGRLLGVQLAGREFPTTIEDIVAEGPASQKPIKRGEVVRSINPMLIQPGPEWDPNTPNPIVAEMTVGETTYNFFPSQLPFRSLPVHPSQIYASINGLLLCWIIWIIQPLPTRDGVVFCIAIALYAVSRFLLEGVRSDEVGQFGTILTVAQWVSLASFSAALVGLMVLSRRPEGRIWNWSPAK